MEHLNRTYMKKLCRMLAMIWLVVGSAMLAPAVQITFQVNMSSQTSLGNFDPANDSVVVAGNPINGWSTSASPLTSSAANTNIWTGTFDVQGTQGATAQYKFVMFTPQGVVWEGN